METHKKAKRTDFWIECIAEEGEQDSFEHVRGLIKHSEQQLCGARDEAGEARRWTVHQPQKEFSLQNGLQTERPKPQRLQSFRS